MKKLQFLSALFLFLAFNRTALGLDPACEPILKAGEARSKVPSWQSVTVVNGKMKIEYLKSGTQHFMRIDGGTWEKMPISPDEAERTLANQVRSGDVKMTACREEGSHLMDGVDVTVIGYSLEISGAPVAKSKLYIGKADGLPYAQIGESVEARYRYERIDTP